MPCGYRPLGCLLSLVTATEPALIFHLATVQLHPLLMRTMPCLSCCPPQLPACLLSWSSLPCCSPTGGRLTSLQVLIPRRAILPALSKPLSPKVKTKKFYKLLFANLRVFSPSCVLQEQVTTRTRSNYMDKSHLTFAVHKKQRNQLIVIKW